MLIPRGTPVYENLATSYVLVEALVDDLCEGGFSGIVEVVLRDTDSRIIIESGRVAAVVEERSVGGGLANSDSGRLSGATVEDLAARARRERGRISVYSFSPRATAALAGLVHAQPLYTALSTEFADLGKMISKLRRESERQWFVEVSTLAGSKALIYIEDDSCLVLGSSGEQLGRFHSEADLAGSSALDQLLEECSRSGGTFDVYLRPPAAVEEPPDEAELSSTIQPAGEPPETSIEELPDAAVSQPAAAVTESQQQNDLLYTSGPLPFLSVDDQVPALEEDVMGMVAPVESAVGAQSPDDAEPASPLLFVDQSEEGEFLSVESTQQLLSVAVSASATGAELPNENLLNSENANSNEAQRDASGLRESAPVVEIDLGMEQEAEVMADVKRLMGEITRTIDEASRAVEQRDAFPMYLRAGQLKIADRYPFLDPFGADFEYLGGEIEFAGRATPEEFIEGLTEGLRLAVVGVVQSSAQPARVRAQVTEGLTRLLERLRPELERFGLEHSIEQILGS